MHDKQLNNCLDVVKAPNQVLNTILDYRLVL